MPIPAIPAIATPTQKNNKSLGKAKATARSCLSPGKSTEKGQIRSLAHLFASESWLGSVLRSLVWRIENPEEALEGEHLHNLLLLSLAIRRNQK